MKWLSTLLLLLCPLSGNVHADSPPTSLRAQLLELERVAASRPETAVPFGVDPVVWDAVVPADNIMTPARVELGRKLFFETRLSADGSVACATCHDSTHGFAEAQATSVGALGRRSNRNAPSLLNAALLGVQGWEGSATDLEEQAMRSLTAATHMGQPSAAAAVAAIASDPQYPPLFKAAYGRSVNPADLARALAAFERTLVFLDAPFDRWMRGEATALGDDARRGWRLFKGKAACIGCHSMTPLQPLGTDNRFHNTGVAGSSVQAKAVGETGRYAITGAVHDRGAFRTAPLRNVGITAPYMHDGSMATLWDVVEHYNRGGAAPLQRHGTIKPLGLSRAEQADLVAFLFSLTDVQFGFTNAVAASEQSRRHDRRLQLAKVVVPPAPRVAKRPAPAPRPAVLGQRAPTK